MTLTRKSCKVLFSALVIACLTTSARPLAQAAALEPIQYTLRVVDAEKHLAGIEARIPTGGRASIDLMMPVWTPGYYVLEDYAGRVRDLSAKGPDGSALTVSKPKGNRWTIETKGAPQITLSYVLVAQGRSVTSNWVDAELGHQRRRGVHHARRTGAPPARRADRAATHVEGLRIRLASAPDGQPHHYRAADFDTLADSPIVAGTLKMREFTVDGSTHVLVDAGQYAQWNGDKAVKPIEKFVKEVRTFWGSLPFTRYVFLNVFRQGGGGLEHSNSTLLTSSPKMTEPTTSWLSFVAPNASGP